MIPLIEIKNLRVEIEGKEVLKGLNLTINEGEIHVIMGPNGSGKSTLSNVIMGHPKYKVIEGEIIYRGENLLNLKPHERALRGVFLAFQYPKEIAGVTMEEFLLEAYRSKEKFENPKSPGILIFRFKKMMKEIMDKLKISNDFSERYLNYGFSGGEKKKTEILQMALLKPHFSVLDEIDSGLDIDALKVVSKNINTIKEDNKEMGILLITHYQRILKYLHPDFVHVMKDGRIIKSGGKDFAHELEESGYENL